MERSRIIKAALALDTFTVDELAAHAAANANTVRSYVTTRDHELFVLAGTEEPGSRGRPRSRYRLRDRGAASRVLRDAQRRRTPDDEELIRRAGEPLALPAVADELAGNAAAPALADRLDWAASRLSLAQAADDAEEMRAHAELARIGAREVIADAPRDSAIAQEARLVDVFAALLSGGQEHSRMTLRNAADEVADLVGRASLGFAGQTLAALTTLARRVGASPPIAVVAHASVDRPPLLGGLGDSVWESARLVGSADTVWWPTWASSLYECKAVAGVVVDHAGGIADDQFDTTIRAAKTWHLPTVVCNFPADSAWGGRALAHGAAPQPTFDADAAISYIGQALEDLSAGAGVSDLRGPRAFGFRLEEPGRRREPVTHAPARGSVRNPRRSM